MIATLGDLKINGDAGMKTANSLLGKLCDLETVLDCVASSLHYNVFSLFLLELDLAVSHVAVEITLAVRDANFPSLIVLALALLELWL